VRGQRLDPAGIPVRAFPHVWIDRGQLLSEQQLASALASYLQATPGLDVRIVDSDQLAAVRAGGLIPAATVLVKLRLQTHEQMRVQWTTRPQTVCDALGCFTVTQQYNYDVPVMDAELSISIQEAQSARELQHAVLRGHEEGRN
jgi:hypothetical protein